MNISVPKEAITSGPDVQWNHIDGPYMTWAGHGRWLTWRERFLIWIGRQTVDEIACSHWPYLDRSRDEIRRKDESRLQRRYELLRECQSEFRALGCTGLVETIETELRR